MMGKPKFTAGKSQLLFTVLIDEENEVMVSLKYHYWIIREIFKYQSAIATSANSPTFAIPLNFYTEFARVTDILSGKEISVSESDTLFLTMNKRTKASPLNPGTALIRFQFVEIIMRLALKKFPSIPSSADRVDVFMRKLIIKKSPIEKAQDWRWR